MFTSVITLGSAVNTTLCRFVTTIRYVLNLICINVGILISSRQKKKKHEQHVWSWSRATMSSNAFSNHFVRNYRISLLEGQQSGRVFDLASKSLNFCLLVGFFFIFFGNIMAVYVTREELDKILFSKIESIEKTCWTLMATRNTIKDDLKSVSRSCFKKLLKESVISKDWLVYFVCS